MDRILPTRRRAGPRRDEPTAEQPAFAETGHHNQHVKAPPSALQGHFVAMSGEFVGTIMFLYFAFGATQIANVLNADAGPNTSGLLYISLAFGFSLATTAWVFYRVSGGLFNPAVSGLVHPPLQ